MKAKAKRMMIHLRDKKPFLYPGIPAVGAAIAGCNGSMVWGNLLASVAAIMLFLTTISISPGSEP